MSKQDMTYDFRESGCVKIPCCATCKYLDNGYGDYKTNCFVTINIPHPLTVCDKYKMNDDTIIGNF